MDKLLEILEKNPRLSNSEIAVMLGKTEKETEEQIRLYEESGVIKGYRAMIDKNKANAQTVTALIEIRVQPKFGHGFDEIANRIAALEEVESIYLMSGGFDLCCMVSDKSFEEIALFVANRLSPLDGVMSTATHFILKKYKEQGVFFTEPPKDDRGDTFILMDYNNYLNPTLVSIKPSGIRKFFSIAEEMDNVISLGVGEPDFKTPWHIRQMGINSLEQGSTRYTANAGLALLREEIANYYKRRFNVNYNPKDEIMVTVGGSEGIDMAIRSLVCPGDEVLVVEPSFVCYKPIIEICGGVAVPIVTKNEDNFKLMPEEIENAVTDKTKLIVLPFPNNPTGAVMRKEDLEKIAEVIKKHDLLVLSDEIYCELTYGGEEHTTIASLDGMQERTIVINGFSKTYSMTGWRLGYALGPAPIIKQMTKLHQYAIMSAPTTSQYAAIEALRHGDEDIRKMRDDYDMRRRFTVNAFREIGLDCFEPEGAFYVFPCIKSTGLSSEEFCERLIRAKRVAVVPGNAFGDCGEGFIRASYCYSIDNIKEAVRRIGEFVKELGEN